MNTLDSSNYSRYNRQILLPEIGIQGQLTLLNTSVLVVGAGGLGCPVLQYLAAAGIGHIGIIDSDIVELSNLQRQILYCNTDLGLLKVDAVESRIAQLNPSVKINKYPVRLTSDNALDIIKDYDLVIDGSDNFPTRFLVNDACVLLGKPFVFGAIFQYEGQVSVFNYEGGPTYRCLVPEYPDGSQILTCSEVGVLGVVTGVIGTLMACEAIKVITGIGQTLSGRLLTVDTISMQFNTFNIEKDNSTVVTHLLNYVELCNSINKEVRVKTIAPSELRTRLAWGDNIMLIDLRDVLEFHEYSIPGSKNVPLPLIEEYIKQIDERCLIVLICSLGIKSADIIHSFNSQDYNLVSLEGGIAEWI